MLLGKTVTIDAPGLEYVYIDYSKTPYAVLRIPHCERIKYIRCKQPIDDTFIHMQHLGDTFIGDFGNVVTLILYITQNETNKHDLSCLSKMPQLRYLSLIFGGNAMSNLQEVEVMPSSKLLKILSITSTTVTDDWWRVVDKGTLDLKKVMSNFENLETLELFGINLKTIDGIQADQLVFLKLRNVKYSNRMFSLNAPKLKTLSLEVDMLYNLQLSKNHHLSKLYVDLGVTLFEESFDHIICPFLQEHKHIKNLTLIRGICSEDHREDDVIYDRIVESVEKVENLELHRFDIPINFLRSLPGWKSLKSLKLVSCSINCSGMRDDVVRMSGVERMIIDRVQVDGTLRTDFPIVLVDGTNQEVVSEEYNTFTTLNFGRKPPTHKKYKSSLFSCPEIDPVGGFNIGSQINAP